MGTPLHTWEWYNVKSQHPFSFIFPALGCSTLPPPTPASLKALFYDQSQPQSFKIRGIAAGGMLKAVLLSSFPHLPLLLHSHEYIHIHSPNAWASPALSWLHTAMQSAQFCKIKISKSAGFEWKRSLHLGNTLGSFDAVPLSSLDKQRHSL